MVENMSIENNELLLKIIENQKQFIYSLEALTVHFKKIDNIEDIITNGIVTKDYYEQEHKKLEEFTKKNLEEIRLEYRKDLRSNRWFIIGVVGLSNIIISGIMLYIHTI